MDKAVPKLDQAKWTELISVAKTPLALAVLLILVLSAALFYVPFNVSGSYRIVFTVGIIVFQLVLIIGIFIIAWFRPESLYGKRVSPHRQTRDLKEQIRELTTRIELQMNVKSQIRGLFRLEDSFTLESLLQALGFSSDDAKAKRSVLAALGNLLEENKIAALPEEPGRFQRRRANSQSNEIGL